MLQVLCCSASRDAVSHWDPCWFVNQLISCNAFCSLPLADWGKAIKRATVCTSTGHAVPCACRYPYVLHATIEGTTLHVHDHEHDHASVHDYKSQ